MQKMMVIEGKEEIDGYEFLEFGLASETIDGLVQIYTVVICKDLGGYLDQFPIHKVKFI